MSYYVYELVDPRDGTVFYVGKGVRLRIHAHELEAKQGRVSRKCDRIRSIWADGLEVTKRQVRSFTSEQAAYDFEAERVSHYGLASLTNIIPGGGYARGGPFISVDRQAVSAIAECFNRTKGGQINAINVQGKRFDLAPILEAYKARVDTIASHRGIAWVNAIAATKGVVFAHAAA